MSRYKVEVRVSYVITAESADEARIKIEEGAEYPVVPYDDNTYCDDVEVVRVVEVHRPF